MTNQTKIQPNQRQKTVVQLTRVFESYLGFPKVDAELDQKRQQQNSAFQRSEREKTKNTELIRQIASNVHSDVRAVTLRLSDRGATMPAVVPVPVAGKSSIEALSKIQSEIGRNRRDIESALREIDEIVRFYGTVKVVGFILLGIIGLVATLVLTGNIPLYSVMGS